MKTGSALTMLVVVCGVWGCVRGPLDGQFIGQVVDFHGYGIVEGDVITITAHNKRTGNWDVLGEAVSQSAAVEVNGAKLYPWAATIDLNQRSNWACYFEASCLFPAEGVYDSEFRLLENGHYLVTFDSVSDGCISERIQAGEGPISIGKECAGDSSPVLHLKTIVDGAAKWGF